MQRILKEVTEHMEEQYSAHHYLEKLRSDNESLAMKEKDRKVTPNAGEKNRHDNVYIPM